MPYLILLLLLLPYFGLASRRVQEALRRFHDNRLHGGMLAAMLIIPYVLAALPEAGSNPAAFADGLLRMAAYLFIPSLALLYRPAGRRPLDVFDITAVLALWFPIEFDWLPGNSIRLAEGLSLPVAKLIGVDLALLLFLVIRPLDGLGYRYRLGWNSIRKALLALGAFGAIGLPLGFGLRFLTFGLAPFDPAAWLASLLAIYFLIGIPEELLFRGIIQNLMQRRFGQDWRVLAAAALIFGAAHLNNATPGYAVPNLAYMLMATLAGLAYGWTWQRTGSIAAAALTHALVDWIWGVVLAG